MLRIVSVIALAAVAAVSGSRLVCWLPCGLERDTTYAQSAEVESHCGHPAAATANRLVGFDAGCNDCDQARLADAERLASRNSPVAGLDHVAAGSVTIPARTSSAQTRSRADAPPGRRSSAPVPLPLRI